MLALAARQVAVAAQLGADEMQSEFDDTNPWSMVLLGALPFRPAPCWLTFQRYTGN